MITAVTYAAIVAAGVCLLIGIWSALHVLPKQRDALTAMTLPQHRGDDEIPGPVTNQSVSTTVESVAKLAGALKDLDRVAQMFTLALGFLAVAAVAAGVDSIAQAVK